MNVFKNIFFLGRYTSVYNPYKYLIAVETENKVKKFISKERPLREYRNEIEKLKKLISAVGSLPVTIPMHLFYLDCNHINQVNTHTAYVLCIYMLYHPFYLNCNGFHINQVNTPEVNSYSVRYVVYSI